MSKNIQTQNIAIAILTREGDYMIMPVNFKLNNANHFRPIYRMKIDLGGETIEFMKVTVSGRLMYKQI